MISSTFTIAFNFRVENTDLLVPLLADVEIHHSDTYYLIKNFRTGDNPARFILPNIKIKKVGALWVHCDSEKETMLSVEVGKAIDSR